MTTTPSHIQVPEGFVPACVLADLPERGKHTIHVDDTRILIIVCDGEFYAIEDRCPQTGRSIAHGAVLDHAITSPTTGARYDLKTGLYLDGGPSGPFQSYRLTLYPLRVVGETVYLRLPGA